MVQPKIRLKFRVHGTDGVSSDGIPTPQWTEKWGVSLFDYEEFHVTDHLLKLPFREESPKTVCVFSILGGSLSFRMMDPDRAAFVGKKTTRQSLVTQGDEIRIGDLIRIEIIQAPPKRAINEEGGPTLSSSLEIVPKEEEGPTLTFVPTETAISVAAKVAADKAQRKKNLENRTPEKKQETQSEDRTPVERGETISKQPELVFTEMREKSVEVPEPSIRINAEQRIEKVGRSPPREVPLRPSHLGTKPSSKFPKRSLIEEPKIELVQSPHAHRDETFQKNDDFDARIPEARLSSELSWSEKILTAVSRVLRRDDLEPVEDPFPVIQPGEYGPDLESISHRPIVTGLAPPEIRRQPRVWVPQAQSRQSRLTVRSFFFLLGAALALYVAVDFIRIQIRIQQQQDQKANLDATPSKREYKRGLPIEVLEMQIQRLRR